MASLFYIRRPHFTAEIVHCMFPLKLWKAVTCQDLIGLKCQTWDLNPDLWSLKPMVLTTGWSWNLLLLFFLENMKMIHLWFCSVSLWALRPLVFFCPLAPLLLGGRERSLNNLFISTCNFFPWPHEPASLETTKHSWNCQGFCSSLRMCRAFFRETLKKTLKKKLSDSSAAWF